MPDFPGPGSGAGSGATFTPRGVGWTPLRGALDWWTTLILSSVDEEVWEQLVRLLAVEQPWEISVPGDRPLRFELSRRSTGIVAKGDGLYLVIADPQVECVRLQYGVQIQWQGSLLSHSDTGLDVIRALRPSLWSALFPSAGATPSEVVRWVMPHTRVGRVDYAMDVAVVGPREAAEWEVDCWFAGESHTAVLDRFATHCASRTSEAHTALLGDAKTGRTWYVGSTALYRVYERSKHTQDGHWPVLAQTLRRRGWDGEAPVLRAEVEVKREWQETQTCGCEACRARVVELRAVGEPIEVDALPIRRWTEDEALEHAQGLARELFDRTRETVAEGHWLRTPTKLRPVSPMWCAVQAAVDGLVANDNESGGIVAEIRSVQKKMIRARRMKTATRAVDDLRSVGVVGDATESRASEVVAEVIEELVAQADARAEAVRELRRLDDAVACGEVTRADAGRRRDEILRDQGRAFARVLRARWRAGIEGPVSVIRRAEACEGVLPDRERLLAAARVLRQADVRAVAV